MESKEIIRGFLLTLILSHLWVLVLSSSPLHQQTMSSDREGQRIGNTIKINHDDNAAKHIGEIHHRIGYKRGSSSGYRGSSGGSSSRIPSSRGGGSNFIPVYAAGSSSNRHPHRGDANCNRVGALTQIGTTVASLVQVYVVYRLR